MRFKHAIVPFEHAIMRSKIRFENANLNHEDCFIRNELTFGMALRNQNLTSGYFALLTPGYTSD